MNEKIPVMINMLAIAHYDQMPDFPIQFMTGGQLQLIRENEMILRYRETQPENEDGPAVTSDITLTLTPQRITMEREGDFRNTMVFARGLRFEGIYSTPYGDMNMGVFSREARFRYADGHGSVHLKYDLEFSGTLTSTNELHLEFIQESMRKRDGKRNEKVDK